VAPIDTMIRIGGSLELIRIVAGYFERPIALLEVSSRHRSQATNIPQPPSSLSLADLQCCSFAANARRRVSRKRDIPCVEHGRELTDGVEG
jgi:hypothetical protein